MFTTFLIARLYLPLRLAQSKTRPMGGGSVWSDRIRANDAGRGGWRDQWSQGSTHGVRAVQGTQEHPTTRRHTLDLNPRRNPTPCAQCQNRQRSGWRSRENAQGRRARHCLTRRWPWCTRTRTRTPQQPLLLKAWHSARKRSIRKEPDSNRGATSHRGRVNAQGKILGYFQSLPLWDP